MNSIFIATFLCMGALVSGHPLLIEDDGQWRGEGLLESQDWAGRLSHGAWASPLSSLPLGGLSLVQSPAVAIARANLINTGALAHSGLVSPLGLGLASPLSLGLASPLSLGLNSWAHGAAPIGLDGRVVDTPEVAIAKAQHLAAKINVAHEW